MARADGAGHIDEAGREGPEQTAPPLVANAEGDGNASLMEQIKDSLVRLDRRMTRLEQMADELERARRAEDALTLAEDIAETAPQALLSALADRADRRLH